MSVGNFSKIYKNRICAVCMVAVMMMCCLSGCGSDGDVANEKSETNLKIVTTIFPEYDWVKNITEGVDGVSITLLTDNGQDPHSFQPSVDDIIDISEADLFIYVGGASDSWTEDAIKNSTNDRQLTLDMIDSIRESLYEEETKEGMQPEKGEDAEEESSENSEESDDVASADGSKPVENEKAADDRENDEAADEIEYDEHVWLSIRDSEELIENITELIIQLDPDNSEVYEANEKAYLAKLAEYDDKYEDLVNGAKYNTLIFADRFPFRYLVEDYELDYYAAFSGCSAESEASFDTITFLAGKVDELGIGTVLTIDNSSDKLANTVISCTGSKLAKVLSLDSMQSVNTQMIEDGYSYLGVLEDNYEVLNKALN